MSLQGRIPGKRADCGPRVRRELVFLPLDRCGPGGPRGRHPHRPDAPGAPPHAVAFSASGMRRTRSAAASSARCGADLVCQGRIRPDTRGARRLQCRALPAPKPSSACRLWISTPHLVATMVPVAAQLGHAAGDRLDREAQMVGDVGAGHRQPDTASAACGPAGGHLEQEGGDALAGRLAAEKEHLLVRPPQGVTRS